jgi:septal ring factor EnvC (AmiA/AmiB activator)
MKILKVLLMLTILVQAAFAGDILEQSFNFSIKTANRDSVFQKIIDFAEAKGGYFTRFDGSSVSLRFPVKALDEFNSMLKNIAEIESKGFESTDKSSEIEKLNSQIQSRKKLLETYLGLIKNAPFSELQAVEREMVNLNAHIERLQGQKLAIERKAALPLITVTAYTLVAPVPIVNPNSPFAWINFTNLHSLQEDF